MILAGAGLPQLPGLAGEAKSYAERLFDFPMIGSLEKDEAMAALSIPAADEGVEFVPVLPSGMGLPRLERRRRFAHHACRRRACPGRGGAAARPELLPGSLRPADSQGEGVSSRHGGAWSGPPPRRHRLDLNGQASGDVSRQSGFDSPAVCDALVVRAHGLPRTPLRAAGERALVVQGETVLGSVEDRQGTSAVESAVEHLNMLLVTAAGTAGLASLLGGRRRGAGPPRS